MFTTAMSGLKAANADLGVTSNNIANVGSIGFKGSRAEFADVYSSSILGNSSTAIGSGTLLTNVRQQFKQGAFEYTDNNLDMAVKGQGFFALSSSMDVFNPTYTRAGAFGLDADGYITNADGQFLQAFPVDERDGSVLSTASSALQSLQILDAYGTPAPSSLVELGANLPADASVADLAGTFDPSNSDTFHNTTSTQVFDTLGNAHSLQMYFVKTDDALNMWDIHYTFDDSAVTTGGAASASVQFGTDGSLITPADGLVTLDTITPANGSDPMDLQIDMKSNDARLTQFSAPFYVSQLSHNGSSTGRLSGVEVDEGGLVRAKYTNGKARYLGKVALADFTNEAGLKQMGNTAWAESTESGEARHSEANTGRLGTIASGALEASNVDLTGELIMLIKAQRNFQANAKSIETGNSLTQTIINL
ncbi:MAG: flagellar hook protein FlgE [Gammaproteobacteria bacterium]|nr:flagellar hook protein FlgE [Gammaproteobacteria bacterium]